MEIELYSRQSGYNGCSVLQYFRNCLPVLGNYIYYLGVRIGKMNMPILRNLKDNIYTEHALPSTSLPICDV